MKLSAEQEIRLFDRVLAAITKHCMLGTPYHPEQSARDVVAIFKTYECPFEGDHDLGPEDPCPVCGDLGTFEAADRPSNCVSR